MYIVTTLVLLLTCVWNCPAQELVVDTADDENYDALFERTGYPSTGDIPILNRKIFKGVRVAIREHPYIASVRRQFAHYLTGTLISKNIVITVAHPLHRVPIQELGVVVGENYADRGTSMLTVVLLIVHDLFDPYTLNYDIAMLRFCEDVVFRTSVKAIGLSCASKPLADKKAFVTGWGRCDTTGRELCLPRTSIYHPHEYFDPMLRTIVFQITLPNYYCEGYERQDVKLGQGMLCVGVAREENPVAPCLAVPGAPLVVRGQLVGLQSWGFGCGYSHDLPLVYTSTQYHKEWIMFNMDILNGIKKFNDTELFQATKAYISMMWLRDTRVVKPKTVDYSVDIQATDVDEELSKIKGYYYDIRDFVDNGRFHDKKVTIVSNIRLKHIEIEKLNETATVQTPGEPFIRKESLEDVGELEYYSDSDETEDD